MRILNGQFPYVLGLPILPARRVIAIDVDARNIKIVLAQKFLNKVTFLRKEVVDLPDSIQNNEIAQSTLKNEISSVIESLGHYPVAISLSQHLTLSQVIDLPPASQTDIQRMIQGEAHRIAGLSQTKIIWDYAPLKPYGKHTHSFWVTLSQEQEVYKAIENLGIEKEEVCGITSTGNALISAYLQKYPETVSTVLVDIGMRSTTIAILYEGQGIYTTSIALGLELLAESLSPSIGCSTQAAIDIICKKNLFYGNDKSDVYCSLIDGWLQELYRIVGEWLTDNFELRLNLESLQFVLCGNACNEHLIDYLNKKPNSPHFSLWYYEDDEERSYPPGFFAVAKGVSLQALGCAAQSASLLPDELKSSWQKLKIAQVVQSVCILLVLLFIILLGVGTWQTAFAARQKSILRSQIEYGLKLAEQLEDTKKVILQNYEKIRPVLYKKQITIDTIQTLELITVARSNKPMWFVVFADEQTYFNAPPLSGTNEPPQTNLFVVIGPTMPTSEPPATNKVVVRPGYVVEVCIPEEGDIMRKTLSQLVSDLKRDTRFKNVDTIPFEQRRLVADQKTVLPDKHFAIFMELATNEFQPLQSTNEATIMETGTFPTPTSGKIGIYDKTMPPIQPLQK